MPNSRHIGWASTSITPDKPVQLAGQMYERVSERVHDPCTATALALSSGDDYAIMVSCDLVSVDATVVAKLRERVGAQLDGFDPAKLLLNNTHTHTGPLITAGLYPEPAEGVMPPAEYQAFFIERTAQAAVDAWQNRAPAAISTALGHAALGFNRRLVYRDGSAQMYGKSDRDDFVAVEGGMDPGIEIAFLWDGDGKLTGMIVNVACPSQVIENERFVSADYWYPARTALREHFGEDVFIYPMCSAAGDQSPRDLVRRNRGEPSMRAVEGMNELGRRLACAVIDAHDHAQGERASDVAFAHRAERMPLPMRKVTRAEADEAQRLLDETTRDGEPDPSSKDGRLVRRYRQALERFETQGDAPCYEADVHVLRVGELAIATNPFELFLEFGQRIKGRSRAHQTMLVQLANDRGAYLPTARAVAGGSYSAMIYDNIVGPEGGDVLAEHSVELINAMFE